MGVGFAAQSDLRRRGDCVHIRHTCATLALIQGVHPKVVQERLGHANIAMTLDRYSHVTEGLQRDAAESIAAVVARARKEAS